MSPGFRYHIATIAAIFLALGVGIIVGSSFVQNAIVESLTHKVSDLHAQFNRDILSLRDDNRRYASFTSALTPQLITGRLTGRRVAIVQTGDYPETLRGVRDILEQAGGTITSITTLDHTFPTRIGARLNMLLPRLQQSHHSLPATTEAALRVLAVDIAKGGPESDISAFDDADLLARDGDYSQPADIVVVVGGATADNGSRAESLDVPLIAALKQQGVNVLAVEPHDADISYVPMLASSDVSTVDNADTDTGRVALVLAITGERGNYGIKRTAQNGMVPPPAAMQASHP